MLAEAGGREGFWAEAAAWLSRPPFAAMFVASCALLGLFLAEVRVNREQREQSSQLARSYLQLIDPLLKADTGDKLP
jgi:type VI protein secretion system component VasK